MAASKPVRILLLAPGLLGESLALQLTAADDDLEVLLQPDQLKGHPALVIWSIESITSFNAVRREALLLQERWTPSPLLLLLPQQVPVSRDELLTLPAAGLLQNCSMATLHEAIPTLIGGGRVVEIHAADPVRSETTSPMGLGQWLLINGLQQISDDLRVIEAMLQPPPEHPLLRLILEGRRRELRCSRSFLLWLWGPLQLGFDHPLTLQSDPVTAGPFDDSTAITLRERSAVAVWTAIRDRLDTSVQGGLSNATGRLLAIDGLNPDRRRDLLLALLHQLDQVLHELRSGNDKRSFSQAWTSLQPELRRQALTSVAGRYVQLPQGDDLLPVADQLLTQADLSATDDELPDAISMLNPLLVHQPVLVNGQLLPPDDPRALLQLETLVSNWLVRTAELIGAELLDACGSWPELRRYMLRDALVSTRELERLRNRLNTQMRIADWIERPIQLYESRRTLFQLRQGRIEPLQLTEPRDHELNQRGWWPRQVALLVETRDALAPQVQALVRRLGDLMVVVLTQVVGRAIGLIGRGIAQGMGRSLGRG